MIGVQWGFARHLTVFLIGAIVSLTIAFAASAQQQTAAKKTTTAPAAASGGTIKGVVSVPAGQKLPEMVVYLESTDPAFKFDVPDKPLVVSQEDAKFLRVC